MAPRVCILTLVLPRLRHLFRWWLCGYVAVVVSRHSPEEGDSIYHNHRQYIAGDIEV